MKLTDIITRVQKNLPNYTGYFSNSIEVTKLTSVKNICTVVTKEPHNFTEGDLFTLEGAKIKNEIVSLTQYRGLGTLITKYPHEVTRNVPARVGDSTHIEISGANESEYNGKFLIMNIPNDNTIEFSIDSNAPFQASGKPSISEDTFANYNGRQRVSSVIDKNVFTFALPYLPNADTAVGDMKINNGIRISGDFSIQNAIKAYEEQDDGNLWGFVVLDGANISKSRTNGIDAISSYNRGVASNLSLVQDVSFFVFMPTTNEYCWADYSDICQELRTPILKVLHNAKFESGAYDEDCYLSFVGDNPVDTDGTAYLIYQYKFQTTITLTNEDGIDKEFMPKLKHFGIREKNNFQNSKDTIEYTSEGDLPNEGHY